MEKALLAMALFHKFNIVHDAPDREFSRLFLYTLIANGYFSDRLKILFVATDLQTRKDMYHKLKNSNKVAMSETQFLQASKTLARMPQFFSLATADLYWLTNTMPKVMPGKHHVIPSFTKFGTYSGHQAEVTLFDHTAETIALFMQHVREEIKRSQPTEKADLEGIMDWVSRWAHSSDSHVPQCKSVASSPTTSRLYNEQMTKESSQTVMGEPLVNSYKFSLTPSRYSHERLASLDEEPYVHKPRREVMEDDDYQSSRKSGSPQTAESTSSTGSDHVADARSASVEKLRSHTPV